METSIFSNLIYLYLFLHKILVGVNCISCNVKAKQINSSLKNRLQFAPSWVTFIYVASPHPYNFPSDENSPSRVTISSDNDSAMTIKIFNTNYGQDGTFQEHKVDVDDSHAVFETSKEYEYGNVTYFKGNDGSVHQRYEYGNLFIQQTRGLKFALVHIDDKDKFIIFQECDGHYAWVQINEKVQHSNALEKEILSTLTSLTIKGEIYNLRLYQ